MPGTPPIEKQQQLLAQLAAVRQQIREDEERVERDRAERKKAEWERRVRKEVELLERERARLQKELAERQWAEKEQARKPASERVESTWSFPEAGPSKRRRDNDNDGNSDDNNGNNDNNNEIIDTTPKKKRAQTETVWAPAKKSCAECKEKRIACLFSVGRSRARACQVCARSKTKCTGGQWVDKISAVVISDDKPPVGLNTTPDPSADRATETRSRSRHELEPRIRLLWIWIRCGSGSANGQHTDPLQMIRG
ncbi:hypothetical protein BD309DRAFT_1024189 [Dichomitus squalens]|uniref:Zn(2)-C6 fungal-type domain-containing protein n=1 Tax=Dichomitus squalens TaxID=114155 RepID=A0A4Q9PEE4_9APHY|nr:hypothetical protein BD311DRAFT_811522 [Dichomitus squalens]TBU36618.1 hypothetical protein BD309DRAFT_1024189 [Dichomitus squalens]TBU51442.1 hypothetical protein BD310DRAFT_982599 [Dichomitus squalens]